MQDSQAPAAIVVSRVSFAYSGNQLFTGFDMSVESGSVTALLGPSGVGKSTLARLLVGDVRPAMGAVIRSPQFSAPENVVYIDQDPMNSVFPWQTVRTNVEYPLRALGWSSPDAQERTDQLLAQFKLYHRVAALPAELSGGELQRLALARCLSWRPRLVVLDEPLVGLDRPLREEALAALQAIAAIDGTTIVMISHSIPDVVRIATRCLVLGRRPARVVLDLTIMASFPRLESDPDVRTAQDALLDGLRSGFLD